MAKTNTQPELRFAGFTEDWVEDTLINVSPLQRGFDLPKAKMKSGDFPVVMSNGINEYHNEYKVLGPGVITGRSGTIGNVHYINSNFWPHNTSLWVTDFKGNYPLFIYIILKKLNLSKFGTGSGVPTLNRNDVHQQKVCIPKHNEQVKISNFFENIDKLIAEHQQKHTKLKSLKQAMLDKMFPKQGQLVPEIRFKGFEGEWVKFSIADIVNRFDNLRIPIKAEKRVSGTTPYYGANGIQDYVEGYTHEGEFILIAEDGANDLINYPILYTNGKIWVNNHTHVLQAKKDIAINLFLKYAISKTKIEPFLVGGGRAKLNSETMMKIEINITQNLKEQFKIADYFSNIEDLIINHEIQITKLRNIKKAFLAKMFV